jgi:hypothetical protein
LFCHLSLLLWPQVSDIRDVLDGEIQAWSDAGLFRDKPIRVMHTSAPIGRIERVFRDGYRWLVGFRLDRGASPGASGSAAHSP